MSMDWDHAKVAVCKTHHLLNEEPLYLKRFQAVLKYHEPGLAPVVDSSGAYHINIHAEPAYQERYLNTFGFYQGRAAVQANDGWLHIFADGKPLYDARYTWCGNFQEGYCPVKDKLGNYFHIDCDGERIYSQDYCYVGDFKDGFAVVQNIEGLHTHIDARGKLVHEKYFLDLDVYHKGYARAKDSSGWLHINKLGEAIYPQRYQMVEPFYNGRARVEDDYGALLIINEQGETIQILRKPLTTPLQQLSADVVGYWKTQTIKAAIDIDLFDYLPCSLTDLSDKLEVSIANLQRLIRALQELKLVYRQDDMLQMTEKGSLLQAQHEYSLKEAVKHWATEHYLAWLQLSYSLQTNQNAYEKQEKQGLFDYLDQDSKKVMNYQKAMATYAKHDYADIGKQLDLSQCQSIIDAGGGQGHCLMNLLDKYTHLHGTLLERDAVTKLIAIPQHLQSRLQVKAFDLFTSWPCQAEAIILARVVHDWDDEKTIAILKQAKQALLGNGRIYLLEMLLDETSANGGMLDLNMLVIANGKERNRVQFAELAQQAGLQLVATKPLTQITSCITLVSQNKK